MKNIRKLTKKAKIALFCVVVMLCSCNFLDIVPDNTETIEDKFVNRENAYNGLSNVYAGIPNNHLIDGSQWLLGDEWVGQKNLTQYRIGLYGTQIMGGEQNSNSPLLNFWEGINGGTSLYYRIRMANTFLENIHLVMDMSEREKNDWAAQVMFLKAYFHFILIKHYGPVVIVDDNLSLNAESKDLFIARSKIDDCFDYVIELMNKAIPHLSEQTSENNLGMINMAAAKAIKARVMLFRASPLFNGPRDLYSSFLDHDNQPFFPMDLEGSPAWTQKWRDAETAINDAIDQCIKDGYDLYEFEGLPYKYDDDAWRDNYEVMKRFYTLRMLLVDAWNKEIIWARTYNPNIEGTFQSASNFILPGDYAITGITATRDFSWNWASASYQAMSRYYTKNGLPIEADKTFDRNNMFRMDQTPDEDDDAYKELNGILQPNYIIVRMYMDREPRFYANLGITGGYWRSHQFLVPTEMYGGTAGGYDSRFVGDFYWTGIGVKKFIHPESASGHFLRQIHTPYPIIRMADLYLMKAEILNELYGPGENVWAEVDKIRRRAGIKLVDEVWSDDNLVSSLYLNNHHNKDGMREIIMRERAIELAFQGSRYWDVVRYKRGVLEFNTPISGWVGDAFGSHNFFRIEVKHARQFLNRNYFWPISVTELNINGNLKQNFGW